MSELVSLSSRERLLMVSVLLAIIVLVLVDLITDSGEGATTWHLVAEASVGMAAAMGIGLLLKDKFRNRFLLEEESRRFEKLRADAEKWRATAKNHSEGLSQAIESQMSEWSFTTAEKEVAFLLLKGFSVREIAAIRKKSEKTIHAQATAIYEKSGLEGRSELAAFFLEDLFLPKV